MPPEPRRAGASLAVTGIPLPCLMLVSDRKLAGGDHALVRAVEDAVKGGVNAVQLREKDMPPEQLLALARRLREVTAGRALLLVNASLKVALECGADGVHLPEIASLAERPARPFIVGRSVHSVEAAGCGWAEGSDYLIAGPLFETQSHPDGVSSGFELIGAITSAVAIPVLAIGGITSERVSDIMGAGASGVAVISAVLGSQSPLDAARGLREMLDVAWEAKG